MDSLCRCLLYNDALTALPETSRTADARHLLRADLTRRGAAWCRAQSDLIDGWLARLLADAMDETDDSVALVAVGGYGRQELCPGSDLDVTLLHDRRVDPTRLGRLADRIWYPIWDEGFHLGHTVGTVRQALALADDTLETATALLSARHLAGDRRLTEQLATQASRNWEKRSRRWLQAVATNVAARHQRVGEAAFRLEPDLKEAHGGLRDVHALRWAQAARAIVLDYDEAPLSDAYAVLLDARVELQRRTGKPSNVLTLQEQDGVAHALGLADADVLMADVAAAARRIAWTSDDTWRRVESTLAGPAARTGQRPRALGDGVVLCDGEVTLDQGASVGHDPTLALRVAVAAARHGAVIERHALERLTVVAPPLGDPWPAGAAALVVALLAEGQAAIPVIEALDHGGVWTQVLPEWRVVRSQPQRNAYHRFTVDRHLLETAAQASALVDRVGRPDLLLIAALLHDLGKGRPGDHSLVGRELSRTLATRMGFPPSDVETIECLVGHHLLLADVASRRDLDDPMTIARVAEALGSVERVRLLAALTEADSLATGPTAWSAWKAGLVADLVGRVEQLLTGQEGDRAGEGDEVTFPSSRHRALLALPGRHIEARADLLTVVTPDRSGVFSRVAGVLALHGLDVVAASAYSASSGEEGDEGRALAEFRVVDHIRRDVPWPRVVADVDLALDGRLALGARLDERSQTYDRPGPFSRRPTEASVGFDNAASTGATVIDVRTVDRTGVLYRITRALTELDLDIRSARVQTLGPDVVDSFYVRDDQGDKVTDQAGWREIERAILHALTA